MPATLVGELPEGPQWEYEVKWDGYRIEAIRDGKEVRLLSRRGADFSDRFKTVTKAVREIAADSAVEARSFLFVGQARQGLNPRKRLDLFRALRPLATAKCLFSNLPTSKRGHWGEGVTAEDMGNYVWVKPELVAEVKFTEWTSGGVLRHAEFAGLRVDRSPDEVVRGTERGTLT
jgi:ATP-dependent DNA ligase